MTLTHVDVFWPRRELHGEEPAVPVGVSIAIEELAKQVTDHISDTWRDDAGAKLPGVHRTVVIIDVVQATKPLPAASVGGVK